MDINDCQSALTTIHERALAIISGARLVGGPRAVAFDLLGPVVKALGIEMPPSADVVQKRWEPKPPKEPKPKKEPTRKRTAKKVEVTE